ncbi:MAG: HlyC/CorC family transporter [Anaerolineales bacterium]|nr:HlyC/CorC family transporter [Anaerolineales bacterium]
MDPMNLQIIELIGLVLLIVVDLFTIVIRAGLLNASLPRLLSLREESPEPVNRALDLIQRPRNLQAALYLTRLLVHFFAAALLLALFSQGLGNVHWSVASGALLLAVLLFFLLEWIVDMVVSHRPDVWALRVAPSARLLTAVLSPLLVLPLAINARRHDKQEPAGTVTEDELKSMVDAGHEGGVLEQDERKMIYSIFDLGDTLAREIMVPRIYITALDVNIPIPQAVDALLKSGYSRAPVYEETVDNILGLLYARDLLRVWREGSEIDSLRALLRPACFVPEAKKVDELLTEMQSERIHMAVVVDEYGGVAGLVTLEDIVEEIVGEIQDEFDQSEELPYVQMAEDEYLFLGRIDLDDFNEIMESRLPIDEADTLGGYIYSQVGRVPTSGETLHVDNVLLTVEQVVGRRIRKVRAKKITSAQDAREHDGKPADE